MNQRDIEQLSSYLDGELNPSDSARLKTRLTSDPALVSTLDALRESRSLLRRMPHRRAPRNFLLTPKMVGLKPPLPRTYPLLRFATVAAAFLFAVSFLNLRPIALGASAPAPSTYGIGGGADVTEVPALEMESPAATEPPVAPEAAPTEMAFVVPSASPEPAAQNRTVEEPPSTKSAEDESASPLLTSWQLTFGLFTLLGAASMLLIQKLAARKWRAK